MHKDTVLLSFCVSCCSISTMWQSASQRMMNRDCEETIQRKLGIMMLVHALPE